MDYEKKYKDALEWARKVMHGKVGFVLDDVLEKFPELKESEDERIRKGIIKSIKDLSTDWIGLHGVTKEEAIAWLEKQNEKIVPIEGFNTEFERQVSHLIASAINREHEYNQGYVKWVADALLNHAKQELEKQGEQKLTNEEMKIILNTEYEKGRADAIAEVKKSSWSENDERIMHDIENLIYFALRDGSAVSPASDTTKEDALDWFTSLKYRVQPQPNQEWNEEDNINFNRLLYFLDGGNLMQYHKEKLFIWVESLKDRYTWKPSDKQMEALDDYIYAKYPDTEKHGAAVKSLYQDSQKLKEDK